MVVVIPSGWDLYPVGSSCLVARCIVILFISLKRTLEEVLVDLLSVFSWNKHVGLTMESLDWQKCIFKSVLIFFTKNEGTRKIFHSKKSIRCAHVTRVCALSTQKKKR